jgi:hypothetical protein
MLETVLIRGILAAAGGGGGGGLLSDTVVTASRTGLNCMDG